MAVSYRGGTRGRLSGRVGNRLFRVEKSADSGWLQIVSDMPESRRYSNTFRQALNRLTMGTIERAMNNYRLIIQSSFEGVTDGMDSFNAFVQANYPFVRDEVLWIPTQLKYPEYEPDFTYDYPKKGVPRVLAGCWLLAKGSLRKAWYAPARFNFDGKPSAQFDTYHSSSQPTFQQFLVSCAMSLDGFLTFIAVCPGSAIHEGRVVVIRLMPNTDFPLDARLNSANIHDALHVESSDAVYLEWVNAENCARVTWYGDSFTGLSVVTHWDYVYSQKIKGEFRRCDCQLQPVYVQNPQYLMASPLDVWNTWYTGE